MEYTLEGDLGPIVLKQGTQVILGRKTHPSVYKDTRCSRNQIAVTVSDNGQVSITRLGVNVSHITKKGETEDYPMDLKKEYNLSPGDAFTLFGKIYPLYLQKANQDSPNNNNNNHHHAHNHNEPEKRKRESEEDETEAKKTKIIHEDEQKQNKYKQQQKKKEKEPEKEEKEKGKKKAKQISKEEMEEEDQEDEHKELCPYGSDCYRTNPSHFQEFFHPLKKFPPSKSNSKSKSSSCSSSSSTSTSTSSSISKSKSNSPSNKSSSPSKLKSSPSKSKSADNEEEIHYKNLTWRKYESLLIYDISSLPPSDKIAAFDLDSTLIQTKSGAVFGKDRDDWKWLYPEVPKKLKTLHSDGYRIVIFTNQNGVGKGTTNIDEFKGKIMGIMKSIQIPMLVLTATDKDKYRKPRRELWQYFINSMNDGNDPSEAFFVGDAAGRDPDQLLRPKKDFSSSDREFAQNIGIKFETPEEYFLDHAPEPFKWHSFNPKTITKATGLKLYTGHLPLTSSKQELILLVGAPASGKSTFTKKHLVPKGYFHVNQDTLKTKEKCLQATKEALEEGKSVVVDNTNPSADVRAKYLSLAKKKKISTRCYHLQASPLLIEHLNLYRESQAGTKRVPRIAYNVYKSNFESPTEEEGFVEVKTINFVPEFESEEEANLFNQFFS